MKERTYNVDEIRWVYFPKLRKYKAYIQSDVCEEYDSEGEYKGNSFTLTLLEKETGIPDELMRKSHFFGSSEISNCSGGIANCRLTSELSKCRGVKIGIDSKKSEFTLDELRTLELAINDQLKEDLLI